MSASLRSAQPWFGAEAVEGGPERLALRPIAEDAFAVACARGQAMTPEEMVAFTMGP